MIDEAKVTESIQEFLKDPEWKDVFKNAPGGAMERLAISFYFSKNKDGFSQDDFDEYRTLREEIEKTLTEEDLRYLIDNINKQDTKTHYQDLLDKLTRDKESGKQRPDTGIGGFKRPEFKPLAELPPKEQSAQSTESASDNPPEEQKVEVSETVKTETK